MRCPECKRFSKEVRVPVEGDEVAIYSDCVYCGRVFVERRKAEEVSAPAVEVVTPEVEVGKKTDYVKISLVAFLVVSAGLSGFFYYRITQYQLAVDDLQSGYLELHGNYLSLENRSLTLEGFYNELQDMYSTLRGEYSNLEDAYSNALQEKAILQQELANASEVLNFNRGVLLEVNRTLELSAEGNVTLSYEVVYAGFVEVSFNASEDVVVWVGSSVSEGEYYARYPAFPETAFNGTFRVPAMATVYINVFNPNEEVGATVTLTIKYTY